MIFLEEGREQKNANGASVFLILHVRHNQNFFYRLTILL